MMISAPPVTPPEATLASASDATFVPTVDFQRDRAANRVVHRGGEHGGGGGLRGARLEMHPQIPEDALRVRQHVHQMRDRSALIPAHVAHAGLQQRLGHREDAFAAKLLTLSDAKLLDLLRERAFCHGRVLGS